MLSSNMIIQSHLSRKSWAGARRVGKGMPSKVSQRGPHASEKNYHEPVVSEESVSEPGKSGQGRAGLGSMG